MRKTIFSNTLLFFFPDIQSQSTILINKFLFVMSLNQEEKLRYARIMFDSRGREFRQIDGLTIQQLEALRTVYSQKIAYQAVNGKIQAFPEEDIQPIRRRPKIPNFFTSFCCCFYPAQNQQYFDITTNIFFKRLLSPFLFWTNNFFQIDDGKTEMYGIFWLLLTQSILLSAGSILNLYFVEPANFQIEHEILMKSLGITLIFGVASPFIFSGVISCLGGQLQGIKALMVSSYSSVLYFLPLIFCLIPSLYWHVLLLGGAAVFKVLFNFRNFSNFLETKTYILFVSMCFVEFLYVYILISSMFQKDRGYGFKEGFDAVFSEDKKTEEKAVASAEHMFFQKLRHFQI